MRQSGPLIQPVGSELNFLLNFRDGFFLDLLVLITAAPVG
jgi:hypothetical protein